jgi:hypothetical protein
MRPRLLDQAEWPGSRFFGRQPGERTDLLEQRLVSLFLVQGIDRTRRYGRCKMSSFVNADGVRVVG